MAQPTPRTVPPTGHTADVNQTRAELLTLRPDLVERYDAAVPAARAAVLARLLGALHREPVPGLAARHTGPTSTRTIFTSPLDHRPDPADRDALAGPGRAPSTAHDSDRSAVAGAGRGRQTRGTARARCPQETTVEFRTGDALPFAVPGPTTAAWVDGVPVTDPGTLVRALAPGSALATETDNSVANLALALAAFNPTACTRPGRTACSRGGALRGAAGDPDGLGRLEQLVHDGHPLHPCCRTRGGMTVADVLAYAPEHRPVVRLRRLRVPAERWHGDTEPVLYAHPWQATRLREQYPWLTDDGGTGPVRPLMSLRTVAPLDGGDHLKTAVDVQMTSAVRTVSPAAVHNGPRLSALLATLTADLPLSVLAETGAGAVVVDGEPQRRLAYLRRRAPAIAADETVLPLAALGALSPADGRPLLSEAVRDRGADPYRWLEDLAAVLWPPLLTVLDRGVALEAHGQNTLVVLRRGRPVRIVYRDLGGVRVSAARLRAAGVEPPLLYGDLPSDDPVVLRTKLAAAAFGTVAAHLVALLARHHDAEPARLWAIVAAAVRGAGTPDAAALLREPLPVKATTAMRLAADPLADIWTYLDNPMAGDA